MGEAILVGGRMGAVEQVIYKWKQYQAVGTNTYYWNRYNVVSTTTYKWNKWSKLTTYTWNKYNAVFGDNKYTQQTLMGRTSGLSTETKPGDTYDVYLNGSLNVIQDYASGVAYYRNINTTRVTCKINDDTYPPRTVYKSDLPVTVNISPNDTVSGTNKLYLIKSIEATCDYKPIPQTGRYSIDLTYVYEGFYKPVAAWRKGSSLGTVTSSSSTTYPDGGKHTDGYWYENKTTTYSKGSTSYGQVTSTSSSAYPSNGVSGSYWYESAGSTTSYSKGSTNYGQVSSTNSSAYPDNGKSGSYWYVYSTYTTEWSQGDYIGDRLSTDRDRWPDNGKDGDYWYVFDGEA